MQLQNDAVRKILVGHYTFYSRAVIKNNKCVNSKCYSVCGITIPAETVEADTPNKSTMKLHIFFLPAVVEDVMANDYIGGEDATFYNSDSFRDEWMEQKIGTKEATRSLIAFSMGNAGLPRTAPAQANQAPAAGQNAGGAGARRQVAQAAGPPPAPPAVGRGTSLPDKLPEALDLLGSFPHSAAQQLSDEQHFPNADILEEILQLGQLRPARDAEAELYLKSMLPLNTVMFRGHTLRRNTKATPAQDWTVTEIGRGHWGSNVYPGCAAHRVGMSGDGFLQPQNYKQMDF